jgi:glycosyltransferase involved in cell wall biosynthesis
MPNNQSKCLLSIVVPLYNGEEFLKDTLDSFVCQLDGDQTEVILCDDVSSDKTPQIAREYANKCKNIKFFSNEQNLGMDGNFDKVTSHATGEYIWFCGQDDILEKGAIQKVLSVLEQNPEIDFVYVNYSQNSHLLNSVITEKMLELEKDVLCNDSSEFLSITGLSKLPGFLPCFVLRKTLWDKIDKKPFYNTQFVQLGVFLQLLQDLKTNILKENINLQQVH